MRQIGLRLEILLNIMVLTAISMFFIGVISFKVIEGYAIRGKVDSTKSIFKSFDAIYAKDKDLESSVAFLKEILEPGAWGIAVDKHSRIEFFVEIDLRPEQMNDPIIMNVIQSGKTIVDVEGSSFWPLSHYKGLKYSQPLDSGHTRVGFLYIYQPLDSIKQTIMIGHKYIAFWIVLDLLIIALFGSYLLSKRIVNPVQQLIRATEEIAAGKTPTATNLGWVKEINHLYLSLLKMQSEINAGKEKLEENYQKLESSHEELKYAQNELIASEKLASLGRVAAGVAHEIGNPLSAIGSYLDVLKKGYDKDEEKRERVLNNMSEEVKRIDLIIKTLLDYSRPKSVDVKRVNVNDVITNSVAIIKNQGILKNVELETDLGELALPISVNENQLSQVLINLILNARDSIQDTGCITITSSENEKNVVITIADTGSGIPQSVLDKIFDPFFTTKEPGKGTGLGLAICHRIVQNFSGHISVESKEGVGTLFTIKFPGVTDDAV